MAMAIPTERGPCVSHVLGSLVIVGHLGTEVPSWPRDPWALRAVLGGYCHREGFLAQRCAVTLPLWSARVVLGERGPWPRPVARGDAEAAAWRTGAVAVPGVLALPGASTLGRLPLCRVWARLQAGHCCPHASAAPLGPLFRNVLWELKTKTPVESVVLAIVSSCPPAISTFFFFSLSKLDCILRKVGWPFVLVAKTEVLWCWAHPFLRDQCFLGSESGPAGLWL